jgi:hypothetical protein
MAAVGGGRASGGRRGRGGGGRQDKAGSPRAGRGCKSEFERGRAGEGDRRVSRHGCRLAAASAAGALLRVREGIRGRTGERVEA